MENSPLLYSSAVIQAVVYVHACNGKFAADAACGRAASSGKEHAGVLFNIIHGREGDCKGGSRILKRDLNLDKNAFLQTETMQSTEDYAAIIRKLIDMGKCFSIKCVR